MKSTKNDRRNYPRYSSRLYDFAYLVLFPIRDLQSQHTELNEQPNKTARNPKMHCCLSSSYKVTNPLYTAPHLFAQAQKKTIPGIDYTAAITIQYVLRTPTNITTTTTTTSTANTATTTTTTATGTSSTSCGTDEGRGLVRDSCIYPKESEGLVSEV